MKLRKVLILMAAVVSVAAYVMWSMLTWNAGITGTRPTGTQDAGGKLNSAPLGYGIIELTAPEINSIAEAVFKGNESLRSTTKGISISFVDDKAELSAVEAFLNHDFLVKALVKPFMSDGTAKVSVDRVSVGKVPVPKWAVAYALRRYLPSGFKVVDGCIIQIDNKLLAFNIDSISITDGKIKIALNQKIPDFTKYTEINNEPPSKVGVSEQPGVKNNPLNPGSKAVQSITPRINGGTGTKSPPAASSSDHKTSPSAGEQVTDPKAAALKVINSQLYNVLGDVKSKGAADLVLQAITVSSGMMKNPNVKPTDEISRAIDAYLKLPSDAKNELMDAAIKNLDMSAVRYLAGVYGRI